MHHENDKEYAGLSSHFLIPITLIPLIYTTMVRIQNVNYNPIG